MGDLDEFLSLPDVDNIVEEIEVSKRLGKFKVKAMSQPAFKDYQDRCRGKVKKGGVSFDVAKFNMLIVIGQTIYPDFSNKALLDKAKCNSAEELLIKKLLPGEITTLANKIQQISGFDTDINDDIDEAKN